MRDCSDGCNGCDECTDYDDYADEDDGPPQFGCCLPPGECCMPGLHFPSECHTAADYEREHGHDGRDASRQCGDECYPDDHDEQYELSDEQMQRLTFVDQDGSKRTFAEELARRIAAGEKFPQSFAAEDW